jgi:hypothetical protein
MSGQSLSGHEWTRDAEQQCDNTGCGMMRRRRPGTVGQFEFKSGIGAPWRKSAIVPRCAGTPRLMGRRFGRLVVTSRIMRASGGAWLATCACGADVVTTTNALESGRQVSCGCWRNEQAIRNSRAGAAKAAAARTRHGRARDGLRDRAYSTWEGMWSRCRSKGNSAYPRYGGQGVTVCERWQKFENFLSDMGEPPLGKTLDRINPFGNYEPSNCRWATLKEQAQNTRKNYVHR